VKSPDSCISVTIITLNEEKNIAECLESLSWADEIVVLDSISSDRTVEIAKRYTDKVFIEEWHGQGSHKNRAAELAKGPWIFSIDADERVSSGLADEIQKVVETSSAVAYKVRRKNFYRGQWIRHGGWWPDWVTRLYRKQDVCFNNRVIHESLITDGPVDKLREALIHYSFNSAGEFLERANKYAVHQAEDMYQAGIKASTLTAVSHSLFSFIKTFLLRGGLLDGSAGIIISTYNAVGTLYKYMILAEKCRDNSLFS
jgi:glycosyltransferase involved in cell wall biosynthesis